MIVYNGYPLSIIVAVGIHSLLLAALIYFQGVDRVEALDLIQPTVIKALTIEENPQLRNEQVQERQRLERLEQQRVTREREQEQEEQRRLEAEELAQQAAAEREREAEALRQRQQEEDRREEEIAQQERERQQREAEEQRRRELAETQERQRQQEEQRRLQEAADQRRAEEAAAADVARTELEMVQSATGIIQQYVQETWSRPPSARNGMVVQLRIQMLPTGDVTDVSITRSSGDAAFDRAAEQAVYRAAPFRELRNLPTRVFNQNFRTLTITFQPEDLLN